MWEMLLKACESQKRVTETSRASIPPALEGSCWPSKSTDEPSVSPSLMQDSVTSAHFDQAPVSRWGTACAGVEEGGRSAVRKETPPQWACASSPPTGHTQRTWEACYFWKFLFGKSTMGEWETARTSQNFIQVMLSVCPNRAVKCLLAREVGHFHHAKADWPSLSP